MMIVDVVAADVIADAAVETMMHLAAEIPLEEELEEVGILLPLIPVLLQVTALVTVLVGGLVLMTLAQVMIQEVAPAIAAAAATNLKELCSLSRDMLAPCPGPSHGGTSLPFAKRHSLLVVGTNMVVWLRGQRQRFAKPYNREFKSHRNLIPYIEGGTSMSDLNEDEVVRLTEEELLEELDLAIDEDEFNKEVQEEYEEDLDLGDRIADVVTEFCSSWRFLGIILLFISIWMSLNTFLLIKHFDPYPFILLNLAISVLTLTITPLIMIAGKRKDAKDEARLQVLYDTNSEMYEMLEYLYKIQKKEERMEE